MQKTAYVYFMTNQHKNVLYTGVTTDLEKRIWQHKNRTVDGFTKKYNVDRLVYFEIFSDVENAILREKQTKKWSRKKKDYLVNLSNPSWNDLSCAWHQGDPSASLGMTEDGDEEA